MTFNDIIKAIGIEPYYRDPTADIVIYCGDCREILPLLKDIDAVVTDPPYELGFMGKAWDKSGITYDLKVWQGCLNALKLGSHLLSFGGTRTYHRMVCAIEDAGFEIRDMIEWVYGSGFPKSLNIGKAIDKIQGNEREIVGKEKGAGTTGNNKVGNQTFVAKNQYKDGTHDITKGNSEWEGWGTALKPAHEPICLARKPIEGTVVQNVLEYGTGGLNIDATRISVDPRIDDPRLGGQGEWHIKRKPDGHTVSFPAKDMGSSNLGRFPANLIHDGSEEVLGIFPNNSGAHGGNDCGYDWFSGGNKKIQIEKSSGSAARFFYCAKASKSERDAGCEELDDLDPHTTYADDEWSRNNMGNTPTVKRQPVKNNHPTVKPLALMEYLIKLITPPKGIILDPFMGSGTTILAAQKLGYKAIGIEIEEKYCEIAKKRLSQMVMDLKQPEIIRDGLAEAEWYQQFTGLK